MKRVALILLVIAFAWSNFSFGQIWVSDEALNNFVKDSEKRLAQVINASPGDAVSGLKMSAKVSDASYKKGTAVVIKCIIENVSNEVKFYSAGEDSTSFVAFCHEEIITHLPTFICEKCIEGALGPGQKTELTFYVDTQRLWQDYHANEKGTIIPTYYNNKRIPVAMYVCNQGFLTKKGEDGLDKRLTIKSNIVQFEIVE